MSLFTPEELEELRRADAALEGKDNKANRDKYNAYQKAYREANRDKYNAYMREYRRKRRSVETTTA